MSGSQCICPFHHDNHSILGSSDDLLHAHHCAYLHCLHVNQDKIDFHIRGKQRIHSIESYVHFLIANFQDLVTSSLVEVNMRRPSIIMPDIYCVILFNIRCTRIVNCCNVLQIIQIHIFIYNLVAHFVGLKNEESSRWTDDPSHRNSFQTDLGTEIENMTTFFHEISHNFNVGRFPGASISDQSRYKIIFSINNHAEIIDVCHIFLSL